MFSWSFLFPFLLALITVYLIPGPDMAFIIASSAQKGWKAGILIAIGFGTSRFIHVLVSGFGLASLLSHNELLLLLVRVLGAGYMFFLAIQSFHLSSVATITGSVTVDNKSFFRHGFITNIMNPKALIFCSLLLPQFLFSSTVPLIFQFIFLGIILVFTGFCFDTMFAILANTMTSYMEKKIHDGKQKNASWHKLLRFTAPMIFTGLAISLVFGLF